jgi:hypothetical protein
MEYDTVTAFKITVTALPASGFYYIDKSMTTSLLFPSRSFLGRKASKRFFSLICGKNNGLVLTPAVAVSLTHEIGSHL